MSILFYDGVTPHPYTYDDLATKPMGGTEATVARVMHELGKEFTVAAIQRNGNQEIDFHPKAVITLRDAGHYVANRARWPRAKHYLWIHDHVDGLYREHLYKHLLPIKNAEVIAVSDYHKHNFQQRLMDIVVANKINVTRIYNPLAEYCVKDGTPTDKNKLVFFSSPHKGGQYMYELFLMINRIDPDMRLVIGNPGYLPLSGIEDDKNITVLGSLPHKEMIDHVRSALCLFYPNKVFPETFGLVMAEANAVGVPVLAHPLAAANEILSHPKERIDVRDYKAVVDRVLAWKNGDRPTVKANPAFKLETVIKEWKKLL